MLAAFGVVAFAFAIVYPPATDRDPRLGPTCTTAARVERMLPFLEASLEIDVPDILRSKDGGTRGRERLLYIAGTFRRYASASAALAMRPEIDSPQPSTIDVARFREQLRALIPEEESAARVVTRLSNMPNQRFGRDDYATVASHARRLRALDAAFARPWLEVCGFT